MKNIIKAFKLVKYSDGFVFNILLSSILTITGGFTMILTNYIALSCLLIMFGFCIISGCFCTLTLTESVAVSPRPRLFEITMPNIINSLGTIYTYALLSIITYFKSMPSSTIYTLRTEESIVTFYCEGVFTIMIMAILIAAIYKYFVLNFVIALLLPLVAKTLYTIPLFIGSIILGIIPFVNNTVSPYLEKTKELSSPILIILTLPAIGLAITLSLLFRNYLYNTSLASFVKSNAEKSYKRAEKRRPVFEHNYMLVGGISVIFIITFVLALFVINSMQPDCWYTKPALKPQYVDLLEECDEQVIIGDFTFTMTDKYYDSVSKDGCCLFTIEGKSDIDTYYKLIDHNSSLKCSAYYDDFNTYDLYLIVDGSGSINMEYELDKKNTKIAYLYVFFNMVPDTEKDISIHISVEDDTKEHILTGSPDVYEMVCHTFDLGNTTESIEFTLGEFNASVSRAGILFNNKVIAKNLNVVMKNGDVIQIVEDRRLLEGFEKYESKTHDKFVFEELIDIKQVANIEFEGKKNNDKFYRNDMYSACENANMRETMLAIYDKEKDIIKVTYTLEWLQMPKYRYTDFILLRFDSRSYMLTDNVSVKQKVYEELDVYVDGGDYKQWVETPLDYTDWMSVLVDDTLSNIALSNHYDYEFIPNRYCISYDRINKGMCITPTLHTDGNSLIYDKESIVIEMEFTNGVDTIFLNPRIQAFYAHQKENIIGVLEPGDLNPSNVSGTVNCDFIHEIDFDLLEKQDE